MDVWVWGNLEFEDGFDLNSWRESDLSMAYWKKKKNKKKSKLSRFILLQFYTCSCTFSFLWKTYPWDPVFIHFEAFILYPVRRLPHLHLLKHWISSKGEVRRSSNCKQWDQEIDCLSIWVFWHSFQNSFGLCLRDSHRRTINYSGVSSWFFPV